MAEYRTPDEEQQTEAHRDRVQRVLDQAARNAASLLAAMKLGEPPEVVDMWVDRLWDGLRDSLSDDHPDGRGTLRADEDRLLAIVMLLERAADRESDAVIAAVSRG
jgi:hypothetical protein